MAAAHTLHTTQPLTHTPSERAAHGLHGEVEHSGAHAGSVELERGKSRAPQSLGDAGSLLLHRVCSAGAATDWGVGEQGEACLFQARWPARAPPPAVHRLSMAAEGRRAETVSRGRLLLFEREVLSLSHSCAATCAAGMQRWRALAMLCRLLPSPCCVAPCSLMPALRSFPSLACCALGAPIVFVCQASSTHVASWLCAR